MITDLQLSEIDNPVPEVEVEVEVWVFSAGHLVSDVQLPAGRGQSYAADWKIFWCLKIFHIWGGKYFTFPAVLKNSVVAPIWSEHPHLPSCPCPALLHLALCQSHLRRTVTAPAIKGQISIYSTLPSVNLTDINKNTLKTSFIWARKTIFFSLARKLLWEDCWTVGILRDCFWYLW